MNADSKLQNALLVIVSTRSIREFLLANDPKAYEQAYLALVESGVDADRMAPPPSAAKASKGGV